MRIRELITELKHYNKAYDMGHPIISDEEYDNLYFELKRLEEESGLIYPDSPTQSLSYEVVSQLTPVQHNHPMLSLDKTKDWEEFIHYFREKDVVGMVKLDGLTASLRYVNGHLVSAESRGNGTVGNDILHHVKVMANVPKTIGYNEELIIDGEIICPYDVFAKMKGEYSNPRNLAAGSMNLLDAKYSAERGLIFVAWNVVKGPWNTVIDAFIGLDNLGFEVVPWTSSFDWDAEDFLKARAAESYYPIDGLVGRFNDIKYGESLGHTDHHNRAAYAFKFYDETADSYLLDIEWGMGRSGLLTPVAIIEPVELEGSIVERASLHNLTIMNNLFHGLPFNRQKVKVCKRNMIIPQIEWAEDIIDVPRINVENDKWAYTDEERMGTILYSFHVPESCPICGEPTSVRQDNESRFLYCDNPNCEGKLINRLDYFLGKRGLDIKGISKANLEKLIDWGWITRLEDVFNLALHKDEWIKKPGFGVKSVEKILEAIELGKTCELNKFIAALGIPLIGSTASKELTKYFTTWDEFICAITNHYDFTNLPNFGYEMDNSLKKFDYTEACEIADNYLSFAEPAGIAATANLNNLTFCITGKLVNYKNRDELKALIESFGGKVVNSVSKNVNYLINNDVMSESTKNKTAKKLGVKIISEENFAEVLKNYS